MAKRPKPDRCKVGKCGNTVFAKGLCRKHYNHQYRYGHIKETSTDDYNRIEIEGTVAYLHLRNLQGKTTAKAIIDADDVDKVRKYKWKADKGVIARIDNNGQWYTIRLNRYLLDIADSLDKENRYVVSKNGNPLDCRKKNLEIIDRQKMAYNCKIPVTNTSGHKGVSFYRATGKWQAYLHHEGRKINGGTYGDFADAVNARLELERKYIE